MRGGLILETVKENTRKYEQALREAEMRSAQASSEALQVGHELVQNLARLADIQIAHHPDLGESAIRQMELRRDELRQLQGQRTAIEQEIATLTQQSQVNLAEIFRAEYKEQQFLQADRVYQATRAEHAELLMTHRAMEANHEDVRAEVARKLPQFEQHPVYLALRARQYGTDAYQLKGMARAVDDWLAVRCNYRMNRQNELTLRAMQKEMDEGAQAREEKLALLKRDMEPMLKAANHQAGLPRLRAAQEQIEASIAKARERASAITERLAEFDENRDLRYKRIRESMHEFLDKQSAEELLARARRTATGEDDEVAHRVNNLRHELKVIEDSLPLLQEECARARSEYQRARGLEEIVKDDQFSADRYDYPHGPDMQVLIQGYMAGRMNNVSVMDLLRSHRRTWQEA